MYTPLAYGIHTGPYILKKAIHDDLQTFNNQPHANRENQMKAEAREGDRSANPSTGPPLQPNFASTVFSGISNNKNKNENRNLLCLINVSLHHNLYYHQEQRTILACWMLMLPQ